MADQSVRYCRVVIEFCTACKWNLRAAYFAQELLQTFATSLGEVALQPSTGGIFKIYLYNEEPAASEDDPATIQEHILWDRKVDGGFPGLAPLFLSPNQSLSPRRVSEPKTNHQPVRANYLVSEKHGLIIYTETKELKRRVRDIIDPSRDLGHVDAKKSTPPESQQQASQLQNASTNKPLSYMSNPPIPRAMNRLQSLSVEESHPNVERKFTPMDVDINSRPTSSKGEAGEAEVRNSRGKIVVTGDTEGEGYCLPGQDC